MTVVCIDTQIMYWAIVGKSVPGTELLIPRAKDFIIWLDQQKYDVIIPSIVVGEMLIPVDDKDHVKVLAQYRKDWMIVDYDLRAAVHFARLRQNVITKRRFEDIKKLHPGVTRKELAADMMIIATALAHRADKLYSHDNTLRSLAQDFIETEGLDSLPPIQYSLTDIE